ncbi:MAG: NfeD family protein [Oscillospiraceae bacterium]
MPMIWIWLGAIVLFGCLEAATAGLTSIWFVAGSIAALIAAILGAHFAVQIVLFVVVSILMLAITRPLVKKWTGGTKIATNADRALGAVARVTEEISSTGGAVYIDGKTWTARTASADVLPVGETVRVLRIEGVTLFVEQIESAEAVK